VGASLERSSRHGRPRLGVSGIPNLPLFHLIPLLLSLLIPLPLSPLPSLFVGASLLLGLILTQTPYCASRPWHRPKLRSTTSAKALTLSLSPGAQPPLGASGTPESTEFRRSSAAPLSGVTGTELGPEADAGWGGVGGVGEAAVEAFCYALGVTAHTPHPDCQQWDCSSQVHQQHAELVPGGLWDRPVRGHDLTLQYSTVQYSTVLYSTVRLHRILIANNGIAAVKFISSTRGWSQEAFGTDRKGPRCQITGLFDTETDTGQYSFSSRE